MNSIELIDVLSQKYLSLLKNYEDFRVKEHIFHKDSKDLYTLLLDTLNVLDNAITK